jgi:EAL and modified HD-GYP domain-containing signal transduction protein
MNNGKTPDYAPFFVARQPIYDRDQRVWGYELFFRNSAHAESAAIDDLKTATAHMVSDGVSLALTGLRKGRKLLVNCSSDFLLDNLAYGLPADTCLLDLEVRRADPALAEACRKLAGSGYEFAVDLPAPSSIVQMARIVKLNAARIPIEELPKLVDRLRQFPCQLLGEKIETEDVYHRLRELGVGLFQGYFFCKPKLLPGRTIGAASTSRLQLVGELSQRNYDMTRVGDIIAHDPGLSFRLLRFINSAYFSFRSSITSVQKAILLIGRLPLKYWLMAVLLAEEGVEPRFSELYSSSVQRGRFLELLAQRSPSLKGNAEQMMLLGLFSLLDAMLGQPMSDIVELMALDEEVKAALRGDPSPLRQWIELVHGIDRGEWSAVESILAEHKIKATDAALCHNSASLWTTEFLGVVDLAA